jgi:hypothetical protein
MGRRDDVRRELRQAASSETRGATCVATMFALLLIVVAVAFRLATMRGRQYGSDASGTLFGSGSGSGSRKRKRNDVPRTRPSPSPPLSP